MSIHLLWLNIAWIQEVQEPSNAMFMKYYTMVPNCVVIMLVSADLDNPKSATFNSHFPFF